MKTVGDLFPKLKSRVFGKTELRAAICEPQYGSKIIALLVWACIDTQVEALQYLYPDEKQSWRQVAQNGEAIRWLKKIKS